MKTIVIEGWRFTTHSYAMVCQHLCLELLKRSGIRLYFRDVAQYFSHWSPSQGLWSQSQEEALRGLPVALPNMEADAVLRIFSPLFFHADPAAARTFVWATTEGKILHDVLIGERKQAREALGAAEADVIAPSRWAGLGFTNCGLRPDKLHIVPCGVDPDVFCPASKAARETLRKELGWQDRVVLLNVSAMTAYKGIDALLKAAAAVKEKVPDLLVALKGSDTLYPSEAFLRQVVMQTGWNADKVHKHVRYLGAALPIAELAKLYQAADAYACPYLAEGFNLPALEALACGLPVVSTQGGPTEDFLTEADTLFVTSREAALEDGYCVLVPDPGRLNEQLMRVATDAGWRESAGVRGSARVRAEFTWEKCVDRLLRVMLPGI